jgi:hypothetical protein
VGDLEDLVQRDERSRRELAQAASEADRWVVHAFTVGGAIIGGIFGAMRAASRRTAHHFDFVGAPLVIVVLAAIVGAFIGRKLGRARAR